MGKKQALIVGAPGGGNTGNSFLPGVSHDCEEMDATLSRTYGFQVTKLVNAGATAAAILSALETAAATLSGDDFFVFYFSGHGMQSKDNGNDERDGQDEFICTQEGSANWIRDDRLQDVWKKFVPSVRILMISDSCSSASVARVAMDPNAPVINGKRARGAARSVLPNNPAANSRSGIVRLEPRPAGQPRRKQPFNFGGASTTGAPTGRQVVQTRDANTGVTTQTSTPTVDELVCSQIHIGACLDPQQAQDFGTNGAFTAELLQLLNGNRPANYQDLIIALQRNVSAVTNDKQMPALHVYGYYHEDFLMQKPLVPESAKKWPPITAVLPNR